VNRHAEASSANTAARTGTTRARRAVFGMALFCVLGLAAFLGSGAPSAGAEAACPNEAIRAAQHATNLGSCRAWERVTPAEKGDSDIIAEGSTYAASISGDAAIFESRLNFGDSVGSGGLARTAYLSRRTGGGWAVHSITPQSLTEANQVANGTKTGIFSDDLSRALIWGYDLPGATDDTPLRRNLYVEDTATRALQTISAFHRLGEELNVDYFPYPPFEYQLPETYGASDDLRHLALVTGGDLLPPGTAPGYPNGYPHLYTWDDGTLHLAGILPDGTLPPEGSRGVVGGFYPGFFISNIADYSDAMSSDGSRVAFMAAPTPGASLQLYLRIDGSRTAWISEPEGIDQSEPQEVHIQGMTPDGGSVFFSTPSSLLDADTDTAPDIYRWTDDPDPAGEPNLTLISDGEGVYSGEASGSSLIGMSDDGEIVYYHEQSDDLKVWDHNITRLILNIPKGSVQASFGLLFSQPGAARVSSDGRWLAVLGAPPFGDPRQIIRGPLYLYDLKNDTLENVSGDASFVPALTEGGQVDYPGLRPRFLTDDGRVFFTSKLALVPGDINGVEDVYEFDASTGTYGLLSSGKGEDLSEFAEASPSGDDVFFVTRQRLVPSDRDEYLDLYDAHVGGGFSEPEPAVSAPCAGEACQGGSTPPPGASSAASASLRGAGNVNARRCGPGRHRITRKGKSRCIKKHRKHHSRHARAGRRGQG
jgi:hypothetical protein